MEYPVQDFTSGMEGVGPLNAYSDSSSLPQYSNANLALGQEYSLLHSILADGGNQFGVSSLTFDSQEELLWMGNQGGHVTSYYTSALQKYTSFQVHATNEVRELLTVNNGILSLTCNSLRLSSRRGPTIFTYSSDQLEDMQCMVQMPSGSLLMGGHQHNLVELDLTCAEPIQTVEIGESGCAILRLHPKFICCGDINGKISLRDPSTLNVEHSIDAHSGMLSDFDVHGNQLVTCGFSSRHGELTVDRILMVYDLRVMRSMSPIQMMFPPLLLRFMPAFTSRLCVASQSGQFQLVDTGDSAQPSLFFHQVETAGSALLTFNTSSSCQALAFGDASGYIHLYGASDEVCFNTFSNNTEFADSVEPLPHIDINDQLTPFSTIPAPHCATGKLFSDWPEELMKIVYRRPLPTDSQILNSMKMVGPIGYAPNVGNKLRNQVCYQIDRKGQKPRDSGHGSPNHSGDEGAETVPQRYLKIEIKYSRMGLDEIDFNRFNRTSFSGLEANLPNSYCNNMIQVFYYVEQLRCAVLSHLCQREFCLACELGFLFYMMDTAQGLPCQASNFLRAFRTIPEASALGLIISDLGEAKKRVNIPRLVQSWTRFMLQQIHTETIEVNGSDSELDKEKNEKLSEHNNQSVVSKLFGAKLLSLNRCRCGNESLQDSTTLLCSLVYPDIQHPGKTSPTLYTFAEIVQRSLSVEQNMPAWCDKCEKYHSSVQIKKLKTLPDILVLSCGLDNQQDITFWKTQLKLLNESEGKYLLKNLPEVPVLRKKPCRYGNACTRSDCRFFHERDRSPELEDANCVASWIPFMMKIKLDEDDICVEDYIPEDDQKVPNVEQSADKIQEKDVKYKGATCSEKKPVIYELTAVVSVVVDTVDSGRDNIVSCIKVQPNYHVQLMGSPISQWYLFNDISIIPVTPQEVVFLNLEWKLPCVLYFSRIGINDSHSFVAQNPITDQVFCEDMEFAARSGQTHITFTPLNTDELPKASQLVAMDAEFVTLNQEEAEIRSDGTRSTIRPSQLSVARISCVRGEGILEGVPFIDDYISTQEQVVDYLTKFSGIQPGDLDATISSKHLTTLKATYQKLRFLIDTGVKFIGHGLKNDFRVINLVVPHEQVIDTVYLFQLPNKRMISLRFLAWHFLDIKIQSETHDSIEDAKTALQLYKKYQQLQERGDLNEALKALYDMGRNLQWKVPGSDD